MDVTNPANLAFGITELDSNEIDQANGGIPLLVAAVIALYGTEIAYAAAGAAGFALVMYAAHN